MRRQMKLEISAVDLQWLLRGFLIGLVNTPSGGYASVAHDLVIDLLRQSEFNEDERKALELEFMNIRRRKNGLGDLEKLSRYQTVEDAMSSLNASRMEFHATL